MRYVKYLLVLSFATHAHALTWTQVLQADEPLPDFPETYPSISGVSTAQFSDNNHGFDIQTFRGGIIVADGETTSDSLGQLYWSDGTQTILIDPVSVTFQGKEFLFRYTLTYASDGQNLFLISEFHAADFTSIRSLIRFDGTDYEVIVPRLSDLTNYPDFSPENMSPQSFGFNLAAANGKAVFLLEQYGISPTFGLIPYSSIIYYDGRATHRIVDSDDSLDAGNGTMQLDYQRDTDIFISEDGETFTFSILVGESRDEIAFYYCDGSTIQLVVESGVTEFEGSPMVPDSNPIMVDGKVVFALEPIGDYGLLLAWEPDTGFQELFPYYEGPTSAFGPVMLLTNPVSMQRYNFDTADLDFLEFEFLPINRRLLYVEYAEGTDGEFLAIFENEAETDLNDYEIWVTYTPELDTATASPEPEPEPEPENTTSIFFFLEHSNGWVFGNLGWMYDEAYPWVYSAKFGDWIYIIPNDTFTAYSYYNSLDQGWYLASMENWGWIFSFDASNAVGWQFVGF